jgi:hypothetical protein
MTILRNPIRQSTRGPLRGPLQGGFGGAVDPLAALFAGTNGDYYIPHPDYGKMWQDTVGGTAADANADLVKHIEGNLGNGPVFSAPSDAARPPLATDGTSWWMAPTGVSEYMNAVYSQSDYPLTIGGIFETFGGSDYYFTASTGSGAGPYKALLDIGNTRFRAWDRNAVLLQSGNVPGAGVSSEEFAYAEFTVDEFTVHAAGESSTAANTNSFGSLTRLTLFDFIGTGSNLNNCKCYGFFWADKIFTSSEVTQIESVMRAKQGL